LLEPTLLPVLELKLRLVTCGGRLLELNLLRLLEPNLLRLLRVLELTLLPVTCGGRLLEPLALFEVELVLLARGKRLFFAWRTLSLGPQ
jgi:hypothetical protein